MEIKDCKFLPRFGLTVCRLENFSHFNVELNFSNSNFSTYYHATLDSKVDEKVKLNLNLNFWLFFFREFKCRRKKDGKLAELKLMARETFLIPEKSWESSWGMHLISKDLIFKPFSGFSWGNFRNSAVGLKKKD